VRMVKDIYQLQDNIAEALHKTRILSFQLCNVSSLPILEKGE
jgi:hypothetical protein